MNIIKYHPYWKSRTLDIRRVYIDKSKLNGSVRLRIKTTDMKKTITVAWRKCGKFGKQSQIDTKTSSTIDSRLKSACRFAVRRQCTSWKNNQKYPHTCKQCNAVTDIQVDHVIPFHEIQTRFLKNEELKNRSVPSKFNYSKFCFHKFKKTDENFKRRWQNYHKKNAIYQFLCRSCNIKKSCWY